MHVILLQNASEYKTGTTDVPSDAHIDGVCGSTVQTMSLLFNNNWNLTMVFERNGTEYRMSRASLHYAVRYGQQPFPDAASFSNTTGYCNI